MGALQRLESSTHQLSVLNHAKAKQACSSMGGLELMDVLAERVIVYATVLLILHTGSAQKEDMMMLTMIYTDSQEVILY